MRSPTRFAAVSVFGLVTLAFASGCNIPEYAQNDIWVSPPCQGCVTNEFHAVFTHLNSPATGTPGAKDPSVLIEGLGYANSYGLVADPQPSGVPTATPADSNVGSTVQDPIIPVNLLSLSYSYDLYDGGCAEKAKTAAAQGLQLEVYGQGTVTTSGGTVGCGADAGGVVVCDTAMPAPTTAIQATSIISCEIVESGYPEPLPSPHPTGNPSPLPHPTATPL